MVWESARLVGASAPLAPALLILGAAATSSSAVVVSLMALSGAAISHTALRTALSTAATPMEAAKDSFDAAGVPEQMFLKPKMAGIRPPTQDAPRDLIRRSCRAPDMALARARSYARSPPRGEKASIQSFLTVCSRMNSASGDCIPRYPSPSLWEHLDSSCSIRGQRHAHGVKQTTRHVGT